MGLKRNISQSMAEDAEIADSPKAPTPTQKVALHLPSTRPEIYDGPVTRSMTQSRFDDVPEVNFSDSHEAATRRSSRAFSERLRKSLKKPMRQLNVSKLEESKDLTYNDGVIGDHDENDGPKTDQSLLSPQVVISPGHPSTGQLRMLSSQSGVTDEQDLSLSALTIAPARKRSRKTRDIPTIYLRRSPRFQKTPTEFHKYPELPPELKLMIWEAAAEPRLLYICNRASAAHNNVPFGVQNTLPRWFPTCRISADVALRLYKKRFNSTPALYGLLGFKTKQDVCLDRDIVIYEPCHNGCRACHCARHQYSESDRSAVRFLAVHTEAPNLVVGAEPCWQTVTRSWPNVETLYLMRVAIKGVDTREKAMIRVSPNHREIALKQAFEKWKKESGADKPLVKLEFVVVVEKETPTEDSKALYKSVPDRKTGLREDIILG